MFNESVAGLGSLCLRAGASLTSDAGWYTNCCIRQKHHHEKNADHGHSGRGGYSRDDLVLAAKKNPRTGKGMGG